MMNDNSSPIITKGPKEVVSLKSNHFNLKTHTRFDMSDKSIYSVQIELTFEKCVKKLFGICIKKEKYKKWMILPFDISIPNPHPINVIDKNKLDSEIEIFIPPNIKTENDYEKFCKKVIEKHIKILSFPKEKL